MEKDRIVVKKALRNLLDDTRRQVDGLIDEYHDLKEVGKKDVAKLVLKEALEADQLAVQLKRLIQDYHIKQ